MVASYKNIFKYKVEIKKKRRRIIRSRWSPKAEEPSLGPVLGSRTRRTHTHLFSFPLSLPLLLFAFLSFMSFFVNKGTGVGIRGCPKCTG